LDETGALARRIQQRACETYRVAGHHMTIGISIGIGIALAPPICFFNAEIETAALERHQLERELPAALEKDEFELFYQPS
jgi:sensor c-di-GMP phosphodiesterase-like protein